MPKQKTAAQREAKRLRRRNTKQQAQALHECHDLIRNADTMALLRLCGHPRWRGLAHDELSRRLHEMPASRCVVAPIGILNA